MLSDDEARNISLLIKRQRELEAKLAYLEDQTEKTTKALNDVRDRDLPNALAEAGVSKFTTDDGLSVEVKTEVYASIPKERAQECFRWLRDNEFGALIKNVISAEFGKGEDEAAISAAQLLADAGYSPSQKETVHPQTLKAFLKEQLNGEKGDSVPLDLFGAYIVNRTKVKKQ